MNNGALDQREPPRITEDDRAVSDQPRRNYSLLGEQGRLALEQGLAEAEWYRSPVPRKRMKELMQRRDGPALRDTALWLGLLAAFGLAGAWLYPSWWAVVPLAAYGVLYGSASDSRWHECGHGTAFRTPWMNTVVYYLACFMIMRDPTVWRWSHTRHHTDTIIVGRDPEILAMRPPKLGLIALNYLGLVDVWRAAGHLLVHASGRMLVEEATFVPTSERPKTYWTARVWLVIYVAIVVACAATTSLLPALLVGLPRLYGAWHHVLTGLAQHGGLADNVTDHRLNTRTVYLNPISRFVYWNMNYHIEHHMFPLVPFHALAALHDEIKADLPTPSPSIAAAYAELVPVLLRQRRDPNIYLGWPGPGQTRSVVPMVGP